MQRSPELCTAALTTPVLSLRSRERAKVVRNRSTRGFSIFNRKVKPYGLTRVIVRRIDRLDMREAIRILVINEPGAGRIKLGILGFKAPKITYEIRIIEVEDHLILEPREGDIHQPGRTLGDKRLTIA